MFLPRHDSVRGCLHCPGHRLALLAVSGDCPLDTITASSLEPFGGWEGPKAPKILFVAEAWGETEAEMKRPLVGASGLEFMRMLGEAQGPQSGPEYAKMSSLFSYGQAWTGWRKPWLEAQDYALTNVFNFRPEANDLTTLCAKRTELPEKGKNYVLPALTRGMFLRPEFLCHVERLWSEIEASRPNLIIGLGATASWALAGATNLGSIRGAVAEINRSGNSYKFLPTYHPAGVLRQWSWRPIVIADLMKGLREGEFPELRRPSRQILVSPTLAEVLGWTQRTLDDPPAMLAPDIETTHGQISCIGFAKSRREALVIPFIDPKDPGWNYWPSPGDEFLAWRCVQRLLESPIPKVFQNGLYDLQYISKMGIRAQACLEDTMLLHHALYPEMLKGLGFLGSIYTNESSWKLMRLRKADTEKRDE